jgi:hypothetical protein
VNMFCPCRCIGLESIYNSTMFSRRGKKNL